jgi:flagellin-specific chaperone FliS
MGPGRDPSEAARAYLESAILGGSPADRLLLAYDHGIRAAQQAEEAALRGEADTERTAQERLTQLLLLLIRAVNPTPDPLLGERLLVLYQWCLARLSSAPEEGPAAYHKVREVLGALRDAFAQARARETEGQ